MHGESLISAMRFPQTQPEMPLTRLQANICKVFNWSLLYTKFAKLYSNFDDMPFLCVRVCAITIAQSSTLRIRLRSSD